MWRYLKLAVLAVVVIAVGKAVVHAKMGNRADEEIPRLVAQQQALLPQMINEQVELTDLAYDKRTLRYEANSKVWFERSEAEAQSIEQQLRKNYCANMKTFAQSGVSVEYAIRIPPKTLNDRTGSIQVALHPGDCG